MNTLATKKITLTTVKSFIKNNRKSLYINVRTDFNGMTDCVESVDKGWEKVTSDTTQSKTADYMERTMGISEAWFVGDSRDYFSPYNESGFVGIKVCNSCGSFILAIPA